MTDENMRDDDDVLPRLEGDARALTELFTRHHEQRKTSSETNKLSQGQEKA